MSQPGRQQGRSGSVEIFTVEQIAVRCGVEPDFIAQLVAHGVIDSLPDHPGRFAPVVTLCVQKVVRIQRDLGVNLQGVAVILDLLRRIDDLEREIRLRRGG